MSFLAPIFLLLLLAIPAIWFWPRRLTDVRHGILRTLVLVLVALAAARPVAFKEDARAWHVVIVDASASVEDGAAALETAREIAGRPPGRDRTLLLTLGTPPPGDAGFDRRLDLGVASPVAEALTAAARAIPVDARGGVTLLTDGHATRRQWGKATAALLRPADPTIRSVRPMHKKPDGR